MSPEAHFSVASIIYTSYQGFCSMPNRFFLSASMLSVTEWSLLLYIYLPLRKKIQSFRQKKKQTKKKNRQSDVANYITIKQTFTMKDLLLF